MKTFLDSEHPFFGDLRMTTLTRFGGDRRNSKSCDVFDIPGDKSVEVYVTFFEDLTLGAHVKSQNIDALKAEYHHENLRNVLKFYVASRLHRNPSSSAVKHVSTIAATLGDMELQEWLTQITILSTM